MHSFHLWGWKEALVGGFVSSVDLEETFVITSSNPFFYDMNITSHRRRHVWLIAFSTFSTFHFGLTSSVPVPADEHGTSPPQCLEVPGFHPWRRHLHTSPDKAKTAELFFWGSENFHSWKRREKTPRLLGGPKKCVHSFSNRLHHGIHLSPPR